MSTAFGFGWVVTHPRYRDFALRSLASVREHMPTAGTFCISDCGEWAGVEGFDTVNVWPNPQQTFADRVSAVQSFPFEKTVWLDADCTLVEPVPELFEVLDKWPLAAGQAQWRWSRGLPSLWRAVFEWNCGVIPIRDTRETREFAACWAFYHYRRERREGRKVGDQLAFREAVLDREFRIHTLGREYCVWAKSIGFLGGHARAKIVHGRKLDCAGVACVLNRRKGPRLFRRGGLL